MLLNSKGEESKETINTPQEKTQETANAPQEKEQSTGNAFENREQNIANPFEKKEQIIVNDKPEDVRVQIKVDENISEENLFRRSVNDKFTSQMVLLHKSLIEDAMRREFAIDSFEFDVNDSGNVFEEGNHANVLQSENIKSSVIK